jgi:peptidoglycan/LPS O-acetylase OafA/YrhL
MLKPKIAPLTSARFAAAIYVILFHTAYASGFQMPGGLRAFLSLGSAAVSFFFVLSGFILAIVYLSAGKAVDARKFWIARFARIYPLYILLFVLDTPYILFQKAATQGWYSAAWKTSADFVAGVFLLQGWYPSLNTINFPSWSLSDETFFYLLFPAVGLAIWKLKPRYAVLFGVGLYFVTVLVGLWFSHAGIAPDHSFNLPLMRAAEFVLGIVACKLFIAASHNQTYRVLLHHAALPTIIAGFALLYLAASVPLPFPHEMVSGVLLAPLSVALIVALSSEPAGIAGVMSASLPVLLGESSFALYLLHVPLWQAFVWLKLGGVRSHYIGFLVVAVLMSVCSFYFFEGPMRRKILNHLATGRQRLFADSIYWTTRPEQITADRPSSSQI